MRNRKNKYQVSFPWHQQVIMRKLILFIFLIPVSFCLRSQNSIPPAYLKDSMPALIKRTKALLDSAYMAQKLLLVTDTLPDWEGFPVKLYEYKTSNDLYTHQSKTGLVYMLNQHLKNWRCGLLPLVWQ
jgi:hypothetical protein